MGIVSASRSLGAALAALCSLTSSAEAAEWIKVAQAPNSSEFYYDAESISRVGNKVEVWIKVDFRDRVFSPAETDSIAKQKALRERGLLSRGGSMNIFDQPATPDEISHILQRHAYLCDERRVGTISVTSYRKDGGNDSSAEYNATEVTFKLVAPETISEAILNTVCRVGITAK